MEPRALFEHSPSFPIATVLLSTEWEETGLASVLISRSLPNGRFLFALYCVDIVCLGVKDVLYDANVDEEDIDEVLAQLPQDFDVVPYEEARCLVLDAVDFARSVGFEPHRDWQFTGKILVSERPYEHLFDFGEEGEPVSPV